MKRYDAVLVATIEENMHRAEVLASLVQLFDGYIEMSFYRTGLRILPLLRVGKMRGLTPRPEYFRINFTRSTMLLEGVAEKEVAAPPVLVSKPSAILTADGSEVPVIADGEAETVFQYLLDSFINDYYSYRLSVDQSGWRTRGEIAKATSVSQMALYGRDSKYGSLLKELFSKGLVEQRFYAGHRGRGGEVVKLRVAYEKELVRRLVDRATTKGESS
jgi:hypothetical protein